MSQDPSEDPKPTPAPESATEPEKVLATTPSPEPAAATEKTGAPEIATPPVSSAPEVENKPSPPAAPPAGPVNRSGLRRWGRRLRAAIVVILLSLLAFRVALQFMLPYVIRRTAAGYGLVATYERHELDLFGGDVGIWHLVLAPVGGGDALVRAEYCRGDVSTLDLLRGRLVVRRLEAEGLDVTIERNAKGEIPLLDRFASKSAATKTAINAAPTDIDLSSPFEMDAFRLDHVRAHLRDLSVSPPLDAQVETNLRLTDLKSLIRPTRFELEVTAAPVLDSLRITGEGASKGKVLDAKLQVSMRGLHPREAQGYLQPLGIRPLAYNLAADMNVRLKTTPTTRPNCLATSVALTNVSATADGEESVALDNVTLDASALGSAFAEITRIVIDGARCNATRSAHGDVRIAGLEFVAAPPPAPTTAPAVAAGSPAPPTSQPAPFLWSIAELDLRHLQASVRDLAATPEANLQLAVDDLEIQNILKDPAAPVQFVGKLRAPGTARTINVSGTALPFAATQTADLKLVIDGIQPEALRPYLDAAGLESGLKSGTLACTVHADVSHDKTGAALTDAQLTKVRFSDGEDLLVLDDVHVTGFGLDVLSNLIHVESIEIAGPRLGARRDASGVLEALGFRTKPPTKIAPPSVPPSPGTVVATAAPPSTSSLLPRLQVGKFVWKDVHVHFQDDAATPAATFDLEDAGIELNDFLLDLDPKPGTAGKPSRIRAWLKAPGVIGSILVDGVITPRPDGPVADLDIKGDGLQAGPAAGYLKAEGVESLLHDGSLRMKVHFALTRRADGIGASLAVTGLRFEDQGKELVGVDSLTIPRIEVRGNQMSVDTVTIDKPRLRVARTKDGALIFAGMQMLPAALPAHGDAGSAVMLANAPPAPPPPAPAEQQVMTVGSLHVKDAALNWSDAAAAKPVDLDVTANVDLDNFTTAKPAQPSRLKVTASAAGCLDNLTLTGQVTPSPESPQAKLDVNMTGLRAGPLVAYLPPEIRPTLKDGRFQATLDVGVQPNAKGGQQGHVVLTKLEYRDGAEGPPLLKLDGLRVMLARFDPVGQVIAVDEVSVAGLETEMHKTAAGPQFLGVVLDQNVPKAAIGPVQPKAVVAAPVPVLADAPAVAVAPVAPVTVTQNEVAKMVAQTKLKLPLITLEKLDLGATRISIIDDTRPAAAPLVLSDLRLKNRGRVEILGARPEECPPIAFELLCRPSPIADSFTISIKASPFAIQPTAQFDVGASGILGDGLLAAMPELKEQLDAKELTDGRFKAHVELTVVKIDRQDLLHFDLSRPVDADLLVRGVEFRNKTSGDVLFGLEEIRSDGVHIEPATGTMTAKSMEITNLAGSAVRKKDGIHALGLIVKTGPTTAPATAPSAQALAAKAARPEVVGAPAAPSAAPPSTQPSAPPTGEIRVDKLVVSGMDFRIEDQSVEPPLVMPINSFDLDVRDFSTRMVYEPIACRFSLLANTGKVVLPKPLKKTGLAGALSDMAGGAKAEAVNETEQRELLSQITASGNLALYPRPKGWVKVAMSGLELAALKGEAKEAGFDLSGGTFDSNIDARLPGDGSMEVQSRFIFEDLGIADPPNGPVVRYLHLPAPLDAVITALEDASGQITVPLSVTVKEGQINTGDVAASAVGAFGGIVVAALAAAPVKAAGAITNLVGINLGGKKKQAPLPPINVTFAPGDAGAFELNGGALNVLLKRIQKDKTAEIVIRHELGGGDVDRESERANPSAEEAQGLAYQLRQKKMELLKERARLAGQARAELAGGAGSNDIIDRLRAVDRDLATTEDALDGVYDLLRPGSSHQAGRRTRTACLALGQARLLAVHELLVNAGFAGLGDRIRVIQAQFNPTDDAGGGRVVITSSKAK